MSTQETKEKDCQLINRMYNNHHFFLITTSTYNLLFAFVLVQAVFVDSYYPSGSDSISNSKSSLPFIIQSTATSTDHHQKSTITASMSNSNNNDNDSKDNGNNGEQTIGELDNETGFYQSITATKQLYNKKSKYQNIQVYNTKHFGIALVLDGALQITEKDADSYNEMLSHVPLFAHKNPKRVLIIGGGDGYVLKEVLKHPTVTHVDHVELDEDMIKVCKLYFNKDIKTGVWDDPRVTLHIMDGCQFVKNTSNGYYDVIIQDSSDPWEFESGTKKILPSSVLFTKGHFHEIYRILNKDGIFNFQVRKRERKVWEGSERGRGRELFLSLGDEKNFCFPLLLLLLLL